MFVACYYMRLYDKIAILYKILGEIKIFFLEDSLLSLGRYRETKFLVEKLG